MQEALYHPEFGYYTASIRTVGRTGDFSTWATLHESLGRAIAHWLKENRPRTARWHVIEVGGGTGELAATVLKRLGWWGRPHYHLVEISPVLRAEQQKRLRGRRVAWHNGMLEALEECSGEALIFSNELVDAFPCRLFQSQAGTWRELVLRLSEGRVREDWRGAPLPDSTVFDCPWPEGQRVEIQETYRHWLAGWLSSWKTGKMLTIDYGAECPALYHRRPNGTLRSYAHQQRLEGVEVYQGFGQRDLTADVNFSDLERWGIPLGLETESLKTLSRFFEEQTIQLPPGFHDGPGDAFQVLVQSRLEGQLGGKKGSHPFQA